MPESLLRPRRGLRWATWLLVAVGCARLISLAFYPLTDPTEARYANIARVMIETDDWITPQTAPGAVFWGKPPLFAWASATFMVLAGIHELSARLPSLLFALMTLLVVHAWAVGVAKQAGSGLSREAGMAAVLVSATCLGFFVASGAVMTDPSLVFATTWGSSSFWMVTVGKDLRWRWRFGLFAALGLGMLAKGPVSVVLVATPVLAWCLAHGRWSELRAFPWVRGTALAVIIAVPWYAAAEVKTPGFLRYFIIGENLQRFLVTGWKGDLYGFAHTVPHGVVWLYFAAAALPWSLVAAPAAGIVLARRRKWPDASASFLCLAVAMPLVFFSFSSHVIWTYALPSIPPLSVLLGIWLTGSAAGRRTLLGGAITAGAASIVIAGSLLAGSARLADQRSTREIFHAWEAARAREPGPLVFEQRQVFPSLLFYTNGVVRSECQEEDESVTHYDVYTDKQVERMASQPPECTDGRVIIGWFGDYALVQEKGLPGHCDIS